MAAGNAANPPPQTADEWTAAFQAKFEEVCRKFWERLGKRNPPPALKQATLVKRQHTLSHTRPRHLILATTPRERLTSNTTKRRETQRGINRPKQKNIAKAMAITPPKRTAPRGTASLHMPRKRRIIRRKRILPLSSKYPRQGEDRMTQHSATTAEPLKKGNSYQARVHRSATTLCLSIPCAEQMQQPKGFLGEMPTLTSQDTAPAPASMEYGTQHQRIAIAGIG
ncbi:Hypothetical predicted protein [Pelobates cultripes]|uniref:Uncharacterized protein n=1 Tax=Pelobates cultripes TaxID=61616 RepID=A0AAD1S1C5_PELCU|nr:Hypothetical predicted protein [Pelobates cultripes]